MWDTFHIPPCWRKVKPKHLDCPLVADCSMGHRTHLLHVRWLDIDQYKKSKYMSNYSFLVLRIHWWTAILDCLTKGVPNKLSVWVDHQLTPGGGPGSCPPPQSAASSDKWNPVGCVQASPLCGSVRNPSEITHDDLACTPIAPSPSVGLARSTSGQEVC